MTDAPIDTTTTTAEPVEADQPAKKAAAKKTAAKKAPAKKAAAKKAPAKAKLAGSDAADAVKAAAEAPDAEAKPAKKATAKKAAAKKAPAKKAPAVKAVEAPAPETAADDPAAAPAVLFQAPPKKAPAKKAAAKVTPAEEPAADEADETTADAAAPAKKAAAKKAPAKKAPAKKAPAKAAASQGADQTDDDAPEDADIDADEADDENDGDGTSTGAPRRRRRRGGRRRRKPAGAGNADGSGDATDSDDDEDDEDGQGAGDNAGARSSGGADNADASEDDNSDDDGAEGTDGEGGQGSSSSSRRRRRRRREGEGGSDEGGSDAPHTVTRVRPAKSAEDQITSIAGSTRLEAKKQRRRDGREAGRRRAPIVSEAEFLARRESVERVMVIRQRPDLTQIGVLEDKVLVEHYVARESQTSLIGNVYLGRVQNVLPSMEAAFIDIGKGRNAVLYAGEVNWASLGWKEGTPRKIESVLTSGQTVLVQVTKDPIGHKGARLTSQVSLAGRFLVYVPDGTTSGISRKLPDTERSRLKALLKEIVPETAGVIVRTAAEGAAEDELTRDVERLKARWEEIEKQAKTGTAPKLLYGEPDLTLKVVRDLFTEDFVKLVIQGDDAWNTVREYVEGVAPELADRVEKYDGQNDLFSAYRVDEQIVKGLDRKVWLPSGGSLVIDRTEAMTVVDVNTGKFTGSGGNLEETVTKNNLEAAEEIVRQLRLRDIGGIIVVDFIDMVLESNRDLVLRRLVECLGRDRTRHQVAEVTSLGLVQMTRKRIGTGLLEAFSENCSHCQGRGVVVHDMPVVTRKGGGDEGDEPRRGNGNRRRRGRGTGGEGGDSTETTESTEAPKAVPSPVAVAAMAMTHGPVDGEPVAEVEPAAEVEPVETPAVEVEPVETPAAEVEPVETPAAEVEPVETPAAEVEPVETTPVDTKPVVVTQVRRGGVSRSVQTAVSAEPAPIVVSTPVAPSADETPVETPRPVVVTTTRRRGASSTPTVAADVPSDAPSDAPEEPLADGEAPDGAETGEGADGAPSLHVPVKKKGARKR